MGCSPCFEQEIAAAVVLALFIPLIISSGGNSGSLAASLIIRSLALEEVRLRDLLRVFRRELVSGLLLGTALGAIGFLRVFLWQRMHLTNYGEHFVLVGLTVWISLIGVVLFGTIAGSMLPFPMRMCGDGAVPRPDCPHTFTSVADKAHLRTKPTDSHLPA